MNTLDTTQNIQELEAIIKSFITYFIVLDIVFFILLFACILTLIRYLKSKKKLKDSDEYIKYVIQGQEEERGRISRELHDTVAQNLRYCKSLCKKESIEENLPELFDFLSKSLTEVRSLSYNLSPPDISKNDFLLCIKNLCSDYIETSRLSIRLSILDKTDASFLNENEILNLYRIIQESLINIVKHAHADEAVIMIRNENGEEEKGLYIFISDDGKGFDTEKIDSRHHYGIEGMKTRARLIGSLFSIKSNIGEGTQICIFKKKN